MEKKTITIEELYGMGELDLNDMKKIKEKFSLECIHCKNRDIAIIVDREDDGYCETCSSPYGLFTIKCKQCGQGISVRS